MAKVSHNQTHNGPVLVLLVVGGFPGVALVGVWLLLLLWNGLVHDATDSRSMVHTCFSRIYI